MMNRRTRSLFNLDSGGSVSRKVFAVPNDKRIFGSIAEHVFNFLKDRNFPGIPSSPEELLNPSKFTAAKFIATIKYLLTLFFGDSYFSSKTTKTTLEESYQQILEAAKALKYPGSIQKSHLITPTLPHYWPICLTFLSWLVLQAENLITPSSDDTETPPDIHELAFETCLNFFVELVNGKRGDDEITRMTTENIMEDDEQYKFEHRVLESQGVHGAKSMQEYLNDKIDLLSQLTQLENEEDPCKKLKEELIIEVSKQNFIKKRIEHVERQKDNLRQNLGHLKLEKEGCAFEIQAKSEELDRLTDVVQCQPFSKEIANKMKKDIIDLENQIQAITQTNMELEKGKKARVAKLESLQQQFYNLCKEFVIVEKFNENLRSLNMEMEKIPSNPFAPHEIKEWMKDVAHTLRKVKVVVEAISLRFQEMDNNNTDFAAQLEKI